MEIFTAAGFSALLQVIAIDLVLAGDNAIVIGLAAACEVVVALPEDGPLAARIREVAHDPEIAARADRLIARIRQIEGRAVEKLQDRMRDLARDRGMTTSHQFAIEAALTDLAGLDPAALTDKRAEKFLAIGRHL